MKKSVLNLLLLFTLAVSTTSCYRVQPDGGQESVLIYKPMIFGHGGVDKDPVSTGSTWCVFTTDHVEFSITPTTITEEFKNMIPSDNTPVSFSAYLKCRIIEGKTPILLEKFQKDWYKNSIQSTFRTMVRDKACIYQMFELTSKREISSRLEKEIFTDISAYAKSISLPVEIMQVSIGAITPPDNVLNETKNTAAQNQSKLTQSARASAELSREEAERNKAIADNAYRSKMGMTMQEYLQIRYLEIEKEKIELVKDNKNVSIIFGNANPVLPIK